MFIFYCCYIKIWKTCESFKLHQNRSNTLLYCPDISTKPVHGKRSSLYKIQTRLARSFSSSITTTNHCSSPAKAGTLFLSGLSSSPTPTEGKRTHPIILTQPYGKTTTITKHNPGPRFVYSCWFSIVRCIRNCSSLPLHLLTPQPSTFCLLVSPFQALRCCWVFTVLYV